MKVNSLGKKSKDDQLLQGVAKNYMNAAYKSSL
jgi:hypothetical protein